MIQTIAVEKMKIMYKNKIILRKNSFARNQP